MLKCDQKQGDETKNAIIYCIVLKTHVLTQIDFNSNKATLGTNFKEKELKIQFYLQTYTHSERNQQNKEPYKFT